MSKYLPKLKTMKKETKSDLVTKGVKGFNKNLTCRDFQYELGKEFETDKKPVRCTENGFHFCENPLDVFRYYPPSESRYAEVEGFGEPSKDDEDTKVAVSKIKIGVEIGLQKLIESGIKFIFERTTLTKERANTEEKLHASNSGDSGAASNSGDRGAASNSGYNGAASNSGDRGAASNSGDRGAASNSGYRGAASNSGDSGAASNSGDRGAASNSGYSGAASNSGYSGAAMSIGAYASAETNAKDSFACGLGLQNKAKASLGSWIIISEWEDVNNNWILKTVKSAKVDGVRIKENIYYELKNGKFIISK